MKTTIMTLVMLFLATSIFGQERVKEKDVLGAWKLNIDIEQAVKEEAKDMDLFEGMIARAFSGMAERVMEEIDITFDFQKNNVLYLTVHTDLDEEETETEELRWEINDLGQLIIDDIENDQVQINNDGYWMKSNGKLVAVDKDGSKEHLAWMERIR